MRTIWSGALSFGLVNIPVRLYTAVSENTLDFDLIHKKDMSRIRFARVCKQEEKEVKYQELVRGYEIEDGQYVILDDKDFEKADVKMTKTIEITDFSNENEIDSVYFVKPYYLEPDKNAEKAYALLRDSLKKSKKVALAKFIMRNRERLGLIKPKGHLLILNQLRFLNEIRSPAGLSIGHVKVEEKELDMALALIDKLTENFRPELYRDNYREKLMKLIEQKAKGKKPKVVGKEPQPTEVGDLMQKLKASLNRVG